MAGAALALVAIFLPSFFLVIGALPFWDTLRARPSFQAALRGINAAVVGLLRAALYTPVWTSAILGPADFALGLAAFGLLMFWKTPPWLVVRAGGARRGCARARGLNTHVYHRAVATRLRSGSARCVP